MTKLLKFLVFIAVGATVAAQAQLSENDTDTDSGEQVLPVAEEDSPEVADMQLRSVRLTICRRSTGA